MKQQHSLVFAGEAHAALLAAALPPPFVCVKTRNELIAELASNRVAAAFVDADLLYQVDGVPTSAPIIAITGEAATDTLVRTVDTFDKYPWLAHVVTGTMLHSPHLGAHLMMLLERIAFGHEYGMLSAAGVGRIALLANSNRREARFERMTEFFAKHGLSPRTIGAIGEIAEELVMNALYDAPVEAGFFETAVPRTQNVDLPSERACEISYGIENGNVFVRVRDTFGALSRERLFDVLNRCKSRSVELDESRGGAGLGMWRVLSQASTLTITVIPGQVTDITIGIATRIKDARKQLLAIHLFFLSNGTTDMIVPDDSDLIDNSVTLVLCA